MLFAIFFLSAFPSPILVASIPTSPRQVATCTPIPAADAHINVNKPLTLNDSTVLNFNPGALGATGSGQSCILAAKFSQGADSFLHTGGDNIEIFKTGVSVGTFSLAEDLYGVVQYILPVQPECTQLWYEYEIRFVEEVTDGALEFIPTDHSGIYMVVGEDCGST